MSDVSDMSHLMCYGEKDKTYLVRSHKKAHVANVANVAPAVDWSEILYLGRQIRATRKRLAEMEGKRAKLLAGGTP